MESPLQRTSLNMVRHVPLSYPNNCFLILNSQWLSDLGDVSSNILAIYHTKCFHPSLNGTTRTGLILTKSNFYAEAGGQENDTGVITIDGVADFVVEDVQSFGPFVLHVGYLKYGTLKLGDKVVCSFNEVCIFEMRFSFRKDKQRC